MASFFPSRTRWPPASAAPIPGAKKALLAGLRALGGARLAGGGAWLRSKYPPPMQGVDTTPKPAVATEPSIAGSLRMDMTRLELG
jgi:hypothetical protein